MSQTVVVWVLTALAAVVVVLTRLRLRRTARGGGRVDIARAPVAVHTGAGALALVSWVVFLASGDRLSEDTTTLIGLVSLALWWVVAVAGVLLLARWLPSRGRHSADEALADSWTGGPGLSLLGHLGMVGGAAYFTYAYLVSAV
ncbi:hypothetical protein [Nocardioides sp. R-C-SC26]|uniref:hypothetical protein n=1 Tax=Nocardioides sp. R-C-SC26 TaxID=2870414 RepID=UPI001E4C8FB2|nr:hypothetical protein [Nocardioides sp. R-C-SC26]